jgi:hypothetical protein
MKIKQTDKYQVDVDTVFNHFIDPAFVKARAEAVGARNVDVTVEEKGGLTVITVHREIKADAPGALKKFVPEWSPSVQVETWKGEPGGPYLGKATVEVKGVPVAMRSRMKLAAGQPGCCTMMIEVETKSSVPLLGAKLAEFVAQAAKGTLEAEHAFNLEQFQG